MRGRQWPNMSVSAPLASISAEVATIEGAIPITALTAIPIIIPEVVMLIALCTGMVAAAVIGIMTAVVRPCQRSDRGAFFEIQRTPFRA